MKPLSELQNRPIGIFDSGIGGLTVAKAIMELLPNEDIIYFGDTARVPYGVKSKSTIQLFTTQIVDFLIEKQIKALVVACNTISAVALEIVQQKAGTLPVIDVIHAGVQQALLATTRKQIGVIATATTVNSNAYPHFITAQCPQARVISKACPLLVPLIEEGWLNNEIARLTVKEYLQPLIAEDIDTLILGCTHYPLIKPVIFSEIGPNIRLIDSATAVASDLSSSLENQGLRKQQKCSLSTSNHYDFYVSDIPLRFQTIAESFLGRSLEHLHRKILD